MRILRADTQVKVAIGPFVDVTDGFTPETAITLSAADEAEVLKHDTSTVTSISGNTWGAVPSMDGWYVLTLSTTDTDTEGLLTVVIQDDSVCLPVFAYFMVVNTNVYDSLYKVAATDYLDTNAVQIEGADPTDTIRDSVVDDATRIDASDLNALSTAGDGQALTAVPWNAAWDAEVESEVDDALGGGTGTALTAVPWNANWDAEVQSECTDALNAYDPPTKAEVDAGLAALNDITVAEIIAGIADGSYDLQEMMRLILAACVMKSTGGGTNTITFRDSADAKDRITATVDSNGNRTAVTLDAA